MLSSVCNHVRRDILAALLESHDTHRLMPLYGPRLSGESVHLDPFIQPKVVVSHSPPKTTDHYVPRTGWTQPHVLLLWI